MRLHTTAHLIASIFHNKAKALITGGKIEIEKSRMDFSLEDFNREKIEEYVKLANELVQNGAEVKIGYIKREEALKIPDMIKLANKTPAPATPATPATPPATPQNINIQVDATLLYNA